VPSVAGSVVVNVGDMLELMSYRNWGERDTLVSPVHRVQHCGGGGGGRMSVVFFAYPDPEVRVPEGVVEKVGVRGDGGAYNTLLDGKQGGRGDTFGEWLDSKWQGVKTS